LQIVQIVYAASKQQISRFINIL